MMKLPIALLASVLLSDWDFWEGGVKKNTESFRFRRVR